MTAVSSGMRVPVVAGVGGGVGTTTVAVGLRGHDGGRVAGRRPDILVCRDTLDSVQRAAAALDPAGLVIGLTMHESLERAVGWDGATAHASFLNNTGGQPNDLAGTLQGVDNIEVARPRGRLFEAWVEQAFAARFYR